MIEEVKLAMPETRGAEEKGIFRLLIAAMRPHQWVKNLFIFTPLLFGRYKVNTSF